MYLYISLFILDALLEMEKAMKRDEIEVNDRQLACARINSKEGQNYLKAMSAAANFAWVNRSSMTFLARQVCMNIKSVFGSVLRSLLLRNTIYLRLLNILCLFFFILFG